MNSRPLESLLIVLVWVALAVAYHQLGSHKHIPRNASEKLPVVTWLPFRFSLRTLLIVTTLVAVAMALWIIATGRF